MSAPLYFFPRRALSDVVLNDRLAPDLLAQTGLEHLAVQSVCQETCCNELVKGGPGGSSGVIVTVLPPDGQVPKRIGYAPDFQSWREAGPDLWIGVDREHPPTPADIVRPGGRRLDDGSFAPRAGGYWVMLADGHRWMVPVVRRPAAVIALARAINVSELPQDMGWDLNGRFVETIKPEFRGIFDDAAALCDLFFDDSGRLRAGDFEMGREAALTWCVRLLALNYRFGRHEQNLLAPVDRKTVWHVLGLAVDTPLSSELAGSSIEEPAEQPSAAADAV
ncbi:MAG TPA: hypothetical protein VFH56_17155 [Acidimicrobiales bacterium]|nr:hypothetical protein [Acidimicrobiales bacterium]